METTPDNTPDPSASHAKIGAQVIREYLKHMPSSAGVYRMLDQSGNPLYVGKAKNLKNRVSNYISGNVSQRIARMVSLTSSMEIVTTHTEAEALLLEANLIKKLAPRYNILLRDDKSFPFLMIAKDHDYPRIEKHRGAQNKRGEYYGPFASVSALNETLAVLQKAFLLRPCADTIFERRSRPCLQYQIKRCSAPCVEKINKEDYAALLKQAQRFLTGKSRELQEEMLAQMQDASVGMEFEKAAILRDRIRALTRVQEEQRIHSAEMGDADVIAIHRSGDKSCVQVFFFRAGQNFGNKSYFPSHSVESETPEILSAFIGQFYQTQVPPRSVYLSEAVEHQSLLADALTLRAGYKVYLSIPQRGDKLNVVEQVKRNAHEALERHLAQHATQGALLEGLAKLFVLEAPPERIEVYDNSHIMGRHALGGMIVAGPEGFIKNAYRQFGIKGEGVLPTGGDDYAMLRETLIRRFTRLQEDDSAPRPDLVLIDGGAGHLTTATAVFEEMGISDIPYVCIAKGVDRNAGREWFHLPNKTPFQLPPNDPVLHYLQRLRDEAHRFAIGSHRNKRQAAIRKSELDNVPGVGAARKKALLHHFGSAKGVADASLAELESVEGINKKTAQTLYNYFHS